MLRYLIVIEPGERNYSAYVPDLPGCITTGKTYEEVQKNMVEAIRLHLQGMLEDREPIPVPQTTAEYADVTPPGSAA
ncbi:MAG TPA: type II toxin-antitoxin system HicB family antitoxin [Ktedonobacteraceae bacterium]|nr:type II toxin-antitoxin system HicB family antitoxin [Ktedonobacteraceae bacterium]